MAKKGAEKLEGKGGKAKKQKKEGRYSQVVLYEDDPRHSAFMGSSERKCTNVSFLLLLLLWWLGMVIIASIGFISGEPERLLFAVSHNGVVCGTVGTVTDEETGEIQTVRPSDNANPFLMILLIEFRLEANGRLVIDSYNQ